MTKEEIHAKYPTRFENVYCGEDCGKGWYDLIDQLCTALEKECNRTGASYKVGQVKEKFGGLRFYIDVEAGHTDDNLFDIEHEYENKSFKICENCGKPGTLRQGGWWRTLCDECDPKVGNAQELSK